MSTPVQDIKQLAFGGLDKTFNAAQARPQPQPISRAFGLMGFIQGAVSLGMRFSFFQALQNTQVNSCQGCPNPLVNGTELVGKEFQYSNCPLNQVVQVVRKSILEGFTTTPSVSISASDFIVHEISYKATVNQSNSLKKGSSFYFEKCITKLLTTILNHQNKSGIDSTFCMV